jgi:dTDP-4-dehydrorhamnose reductase
LSHHNKKLLIIGSSGLVGSNLLFFRSRYSLLTTPTFHHYLPNEYRQTGLHLDITNPKALRESLKTVDPDCVVNLS